MNVSAVLTVYRNGYVESIITFAALRNVSMVATQLQCIAEVVTEDLTINNETVKLFNLAGAQFYVRVIGVA